MSFFGLKQDYVFYLHFYPLDDIQPVLSTTASHCVALYSCAAFKILLCRACFSTLNVFACLKTGSSLVASSFYPRDNIQPVSSQCTCWTLLCFVFLHCLWNCSARSLLRNRSTTFCCNIPQWNAYVEGFEVPWNGNHQTCFIHVHWTAFNWNLNLNFNWKCRGRTERNLLLL